MNGNRTFISLAALCAAIPAIALANGPDIVMPEDIAAIAGETSVTGDAEEKLHDIDIILEDGEITEVVWSGPPEKSRRPLARPSSISPENGSESVEVAVLEGMTLDPADIPDILRVRMDDAPFTLPENRPFRPMSFTDPDAGIAGDFAMASFTISPEKVEYSPEYLMALQLEEELRLEEEAYRRFLTTPEGRYAVMAGEELEKRYGSGIDPVETDRFYALAEGQAERDYAFRPERLAVLRVSNGDFRMSANSMTARRASLDRLRTFMETPEGVAALAKMSPTQMLALTEMIGVIEDSASVSPLDPAAREEMPAQSSQAVQAGLPGVPSLSFRPDSETEAVPAMDVRDVGGDQNLLLAGWNVGKDSLGRVVMFRGSDTDAGIEISEGMVMGALGRVVEIETVENELIIRFGSGDELKGTIG